MTESQQLIQYAAPAVLGGGAVVVAATAGRADGALHYPALVLATILAVGALVALYRIRTV